MHGWRNWGQRLDGLGRHTGFGWVAETRGAGKGPEPGHRWARIRKARICEVESPREENCPAPKQVHCGVSSLDAIFIPD